jgi:hypothetical protein
MSSSDSRSFVRQLDTASNLDGSWEDSEDDEHDHVRAKAELGESRHGAGVFASDVRGVRGVVGRDYVCGGAEEGEARCNL